MSVGGPPAPPGRLAIAVPAYNAAETLESVFDRLPAEIIARAPRYIASRKAARSPATSYPLR